MGYNEERKGYETKDGGLIRISGDDRVRIDIYDGDEIFNHIYQNVVLACVNAIKKGDYSFAYSRYKDSILTLEEEFARPKLEKRLVKVLKNNICNQH